MPIPGFDATVQASPDRNATHGQGHAFADGERVEAAAAWGRNVGGRLGFTCMGPLCACSGDPDCNDLFSTGLCGSNAVCFLQPGGGVICICSRG